MVENNFIMVINPYLMFVWKVMHLSTWVKTPLNEGP